MLLPCGISNNCKPAGKILVSAGLCAAPAVKDLRAVQVPQLADRAYRLPIG